MDGLDLLREVVSGPSEPVDPVDELLAVAKTFGAADVAKHQADDDDPLPEGLDDDVAPPLDVDETLGFVLKSVDATATALLGAPAGQRHEPPGLHHTSDPHMHCGNCMFRDGGMCSRFDWRVDDDEVCAAWMAGRRGGS